VITFSFQSFSKQKAITSHWAAAPLTIDGSAEDWPSEDLNLEKKVDVDFAFKNDAENLFILFIFRNPKYLSSINQTGMTLWLNTEGKKKKKFGLTFMKRQVSSDVFISLIEQQKGVLSEEEKNNIRANPRYFVHNVKVVGKESNPALQQSDDSQEDNLAVFRTETQDKMVLYEFAVPLKILADQTKGTGAEPGKIIKVGFEWGGLSEEMKKAIAEGHRIPGTDAMRRGESADSWSKRSSGFPERSSRGQRPPQYSFWVDVQLAKVQ
jgi:hypothetical protein